MEHQEDATTNVVSLFPTRPCAVDGRDRVEDLSNKSSFSHHDTKESPLILSAVEQMSGSDFGSGRTTPVSYPNSPMLRPRQQHWTGKASRRWRVFWARNKSVVLVGLAQLFGALMNAVAKLLEFEGQGMHPYQILFARMTLTTVLSSICMYQIKVPHFPLGPKEVRGWLVARGVTGFLGIFGMWYSMLYLPLAEATVIAFLTPSVTGYMCHLILKEPFTREEQLASSLALVGVVLSARPTLIFAGGGGGDNASITGPIKQTANPKQAPPSGYGNEEPSAAQRLEAIGVALIGVLGASSSLVCIRRIGQRAHPFISVNYFSSGSALVSLAALLAAPPLNIGQPAIHFALPGSARQWLLLGVVAVSGFVLQFMLSAGLGADNSNRATVMVYTQILFAAGFDRWVFGNKMGYVSLIGCGLIIGSAVWVALTKKGHENKASGQEFEIGAVQLTESAPSLADEAEDGTNSVTSRTKVQQRVR